METTEATCGIATYGGTPCGKPKSGTCTQCRKAMCAPHDAVGMCGVFDTFCRLCYVGINAPEYFDEIAKLQAAAAEGNLGAIVRALLWMTGFARAQIVDLHDADPSVATALLAIAETDDEPFMRAAGSAIAAAIGGGHSAQRLAAATTQ